MTNGFMIARSFRDPAGTARWLLGYDFGRGTLAAMVTLVTILSVLLLELNVLLSPPEAEILRLTPFTLCVILGASLMMMVFAIQLTGQMLGGHGRFGSALLLIVWWQAMALVIQVAQTVAMLILPPVAGLLTLAGLVWLVFALLHLVNVLHGFDSLPKALATVAIGLVGISFGLALLLTMVGVTLQGGTP